MERQQQRQPIGMVMLIIGTLLGLLAGLHGTGPNHTAPRPVRVAADSPQATAPYRGLAETARYRGRGNGNGNGNVGSNNGNGNSGNFNGNGNRSSGNGNFNATDGNGNHDGKPPRK
jgi:hypothetical protein